MTEPAGVVSTGGGTTGGAGAVGELLDVVRASTTRLLSSVPLPPQVIRVRAGDVAVELEWPVGGTADSGLTMPGPVAPGSASIASGTQPPALAAAESTDTTETTRYLTASMVGVFYRAPEPGAKPFVEPGDLVVPGQQVAILEAMKLMVPVEADIHARIVEVLVENGQSVEYGQPLFALAPLEAEGE